MVNPAKNSGQVLLIVLLSMSVVLTVALSAASISTTDITISEQEEESLRAFSAAEAGIEKTLLQGADQLGDLGAPGDPVSFETTISSDDSFSEYNYPVEIAKGESATFWLVKHDEQGQPVSSCVAPSDCYQANPQKITICYGRENTPSDNNPPAIEAIIYYQNSPGDNTTMEYKKLTSDPWSIRRTSYNNFGPNDGACTDLDGKNYAFSRELDLSGIPNTNGAIRFIRIKMHYNDLPHPVGIATPQEMPAQGVSIESTGRASSATRKIEVQRLIPDAPPILDYAAYSEGGMTK